MDPPHDPRRAPPEEAERDAERGAAADPEAWARRYRPVLLRRVRRILQNRDDAEEVCQETFVKALSAIGSFRGDGSFEGWLTRIAVRLALNRARRDRFRRFLSLGADPRRDREEIPGTLPPGTEAAGGGRGPDGDLEARRLTAAFAAAFARLPPRQRAVFSLRHFEGLPFSEVAAVLGGSEATARVHFHHAVRALRRRLEPWGREAP